MKRVLPWDDDETERSSTAESKTQNVKEHILSAESPKVSNDASALVLGQYYKQEAIQLSDVHSRKRRIALYSHDTKGLGHMRRNLLIAQTLAGSPLQLTILLIAGAREASAFTMPPGVDCLTLPAFSKETDGQYGSRSLDISLEELIAVRAKVIRAALEAFDPDVLIVDYSPRGGLRELDPTLEYLRARGHAHCVLGLRDVLGDPEFLHREWLRAANVEAIRNHYQAVWVYGDPAVYDLVNEYQFPPDVAAKVRYTGYLDQRVRLKFAEVRNAESFEALGFPPGRLVLCLVGGGQDGAHLAESFAQADLPAKTNGIIVTGPFMPAEVQERLCRSVAMRPRLRIFEFVKEPVMLVSCANRVIAMGGYNAICEVLSFEKRALIVPRVNDRREQLIRAERMRDLGLLDVLYPNELSPQALTNWLARDMEPPQVRDRIDLNGLVCLPRLLEEVLAAAPDRMSQYYNKENPR